VSEDQYIGVFAMARDVRLRRLFALVGRALAEDELWYVEDGLRDCLLDLAPEYLPPNEPECDTGPWSQAVERVLNIAPDEAKS
jgi:hypothetical protein